MSLRDNSSKMRQPNSAPDWSFCISIDPTDRYKPNPCTDCRNESPDSSFSSPPQHLIDAFRTDGFVILPSVLSSALVQGLNERLEHVLRGDYDRGQIPDKTPKLIKLPYEKTVKKSSKSSETTTTTQKIPPLGFTGNLSNVKILQVINMHKCDTLFRKLATAPELGHLIAALAGWEKHGVRLAQDQVWAKPPKAGSLIFHRDSPYFMFAPADVVTVWITFDNLDDEIGPLEYVVGSHLWKQEHVDGPTVGAANQFFQESAGGKALLYSAAIRAGMIPAEKDERRTVEELCQEHLTIRSTSGLQAGGISIHNGHTWHGSGKNKSPCRPRRGLGIHFVPAEVRFTNEAQFSRLWKQYVDGADDATTLEVPADDFPIAWRPGV